MKRLLKGFALAYKIRKTTFHENDRWSVEISQPILGDGPTRVVFDSKTGVVLPNSGRFAPKRIITEVADLGELRDLKYILDKAVADALLMKNGSNNADS